LLKSAQFLEALTAMLSNDARTRPAYEQSIKIGEHVFFVLQNTELLGILQMTTTLLLSFNEQFKVSGQTDYDDLQLPQTILSLAIMGIKTLNNMIRMDISFLQKILKESDE
jgi:hypothetical protein